ncbi:hypothetical protein [Rhodohalobacter sp. 614A]|uniref:hypothetical protein n=1 Tax=Rhodohalobacter sp. 614A TaxID=2908649 RepID=UPI001F333997|nr:hypothetical protein [Rhodohalobacter sp. 614A]
MKTNLTIQIIIAVFLMVSLSSCGIFGDDSKSATEPIGGDPTPMGAVGNTFSVSGVSGVSNEVIEVTENSGGVSTIELTATITDPVILDAAQQLSFLEVNGNQVSGSKKFRITDKGIQAYTVDGKPFTIVEYDGKVGDTYELKRSSSNLVRKVTHKSSDDDYSWSFFLIKTIQVEETGQMMPGISKIKYIANHRFGLVGYEVYFEDGSQKKVSLFSDRYNDDE